jgi:8-oxo-dGTP pyrophosphatase MutT (NUDIX family)
VTADEVLLLAYALDVSPADLLVPAEPGWEHLQYPVAPRVSAESRDVRAWVLGQLGARGLRELAEAGEEDRARLRQQLIPPAGAGIPPSVAGIPPSVAGIPPASMAAAVQGFLQMMAALSGQGGSAAAAVPPETAQGREAPLVAAAVVTSVLGVLAGRRHDGTPPWTFIAGEAEPGERPEDTVTREVKEEAGLEIEAGPVIGERVHPVTGRRMVYLAGRPVRGLVAAVGDEAELAEVRWLTLAEADALMPDMHAPVRAYLARVLGGAAGG